MTRVRRKTPPRREPAPEALITVLMHGADFFHDLPAAPDDPHHLRSPERNIGLLMWAWSHPHVRAAAVEQMQAKTHGAVRCFAEHLFGDTLPVEASVEDVRRALQNYRDEWDRFTAAERVKWRGKNGGRPFDNGGGGGGGGGGDDPDDVPSGEPVGELVEV